MARADHNERYASVSEDAGWIGRNRHAVAIAAVIAVLAFVAVVIYAYNEGQRALSAEPPLIRAPEGPLKVKPDDPGGMVVPDRDKLVYKRVKGEEPSGPVHLRPGPELPIKRPEPELVKKPEPQEAAAQDTAPAEPKASTETASETPPATEIPATEVKEAVVTPPQTPAAAEAKTATQPDAAADQFYVQLGALGERSGAAEAWAKMQAKHAVLAKLNAVIMPLTTNTGQTLYRLRAGPLETRAAAAKVCETLQAQGQGCFVVAP